LSWTLSNNGFAASHLTRFTCLMIHGKHGQVGAVFFPIFAVEGADVDLSDGRGLKAAYIDTIAVGIRTRNIKGLDAACLTEEMLGDTRVELIDRKLVGPLEQAES
jgi:hypothetical protein